MKLLNKTWWALLAMLGLGGVYLGAPLLDNVPAELELKAPVERIIDSREYTEANNVVSKQYAYYSDVVVPIKRNEIKRTDNSIHTENPDGTVTASIYTADSFYKLPNNEWREIEYATTTKEVFDDRTVGWSPLKKVFADTIFAGSGDGQVAYLTAIGGTWADAHDATSGTSANSTTVTLSVKSRESSTNVRYEIYRLFFPIDTSSIPAGSTIDTASFFVSFTGGGTIGDDDEFAYIAVVQSSQNTHTTLAVADYDNVASTEGSSQFFLNVGEAGYNELTLNATGMAWIATSGDASNCSATTGITCFSIREGHDITDNTIADNTQNEESIRMSETSGTANDPYLSVTYTLPASAVPSQTFPLLFN